MVLRGDSELKHTRFQRSAQYLQAAVQAYERMKLQKVAARARQPWQDDDKRQQKRQRKEWVDDRRWHKRQPCADQEDDRWCKSRQWAHAPWNAKQKGSSHNRR